MGSIDDIGFWINWVPRYWVFIGLNHFTIQNKATGQIIFGR